MQNVLELRQAGDLAIAALVAALGTASPTLAVPTNPDPGERDSSQMTSGQMPAVWTARKMLGFSPPRDALPLRGSPPGPNSQTNLLYLSCDQLIHDVKYLLLQLGASAESMHVDTRECYTGEQKSAGTIDVIFSVLVPPGTIATNGADAPVDAHWQTVELKGDCAFLEYVRKKVLPLLSARNVKLIPKAFCEKYGIGLRAEVLKPLQ